MNIIFLENSFVINFFPILLSSLPRICDPSNNKMCCLLPGCFVHLCQVAAYRTARLMAKIINGAFLNALNHFSTRQDEEFQKHEKFHFPLS